MDFFNFFNDFDKMFKNIRKDNIWNHQMPNKTYEDSSEKLADEVVKDLNAEYGAGTLETKEVVLKRTIKTWTSPDGSFSVKFALYENPSIKPKEEPSDIDKEKQNKKEAIENLKRQLTQAISKEEFEKAAALRDSINQLSKEQK